MAQENGCVWMIYLVIHSCKVRILPVEIYVRLPFMLVCSLAAEDITDVIYSIYVSETLLIKRRTNANTVVLFHSRQSPWIWQWTYHHNNLWWLHVRYANDGDVLDGVVNGKFVFNIIFFLVQNVRYYVENVTSFFFNSFSIRCFVGIQKSADITKLLYQNAILYRRKIEPFLYVYFLF